MNNLFNLKSFLKFLSRNKTYTAINVFGLSVSLMFVLLIAVYTVQELSTDRFQEKAERIYLIGNEKYPTVSPAIAYRLKERYPEIEKICPTVPNNFDDMSVVSGEKKMNADLFFVDSTFFDVFSFNLLEGDPKEALVASNNAVVSRHFARKFFGTEEAMGQSMLIGDTLRVVVSGVVEDLRNSALPNADILLPWQSVKTFNWSLRQENLGNAGSTVVFALVHEGVDFRSRAQEMYAWMKDFYWIYQNDVYKEVRIESLCDYYFSDWGMVNYPLNLGDKRFVLVLMSVGILIFVFAILNYVNLSVSQAGFRAKEMATRRLLGSSRLELFWRLVLESVLVCIGALVIAIVLASAVLPVANDLLQTELDLSVLSSPAWTAAILLFVVVEGGLAGWLPALIISEAKPIEIVRGSFRTRTKMVFSKIFITFQHFITIIMLSCSLVMILQIDHLITAPLGFNTKNLLVVSSAELDDEQQRTFRNEIRSLPGVAHVGFAAGLPFNGSNNLTQVYNDGGIKKNISFQQYIWDRECFDMLGLQVLQDNQLAGDGWYLNEEAFRQMNLPDDASSFTVDYPGTVHISGKISDFREGNVTQRIPPVMFRFMDPEDTGWSIVVEITADPYGTINAMEDIYCHITGGNTMTSQFLGEQLQSSFASQIRLAKIVGVFTAIAILISLLGLLAMSTYFIQQRSMEVAVRKVFGSTESQVLRRLVGTFLRYVLIAFVLAVPVAYYVGAEWLSDYDYRITLHPWIFLLAGLFCFLVSFLAVVGQSWRAANTNPIRHLGKRE